MQNVAVESSNGSLSINTRHHMDKAVGLHTPGGDDVSLSNGPILLKQVPDVRTGGAVTQIAHEDLEVGA